ncbi:S8 family serine peptidase [Xanthovirga aplysinae]|uniref:S8 family serine peptidase n=1 Tax=Xanthovirga aplysinae TaxID=2529853 RepID=UPI0012BB888E|nr:S8 family serine peptidase [Xanthovirga aplysinae]MTI32685.1 T9SS type A sorting domain-containing protein [Xanthovirga aplysinae]
MVRNKGIFLFFFSYLLLACSESLGQVSRYVVYFSDKNNSPFKIESPEKFLSSRAIQRRENQDISITPRDFPVNPQYIEKLREKGVPIYYSSRWLNAVLIEESASNLEKIEGLSFVERIEFVAPGSKLKSNGSFFEKEFNSSSNQTSTVDDYLTSDFQNQMLGIDHFLEEGFDGTGKLVAIFDGGFLHADQSPLFEHIFEDRHLLATKDFTTNSSDVFRHHNHGTKVWSCIGGLWGDHYKAGAFNADYILCVTEDVQSEYRIEEYNWLFAAEYADSAGVDIINSSLGYFVFDDKAMDYSREDLDGQTTIVSQAAQMAAERGILVVTAAGNEGITFWNQIIAPADAKDVLTVGAVSDDFSHVSFSSSGPTADGRIKPDVSAQGYETVLASKDGTSLERGNGTSFSTPLVTALATLYWQQNPELRNIDVIKEIKQVGHQAKNPNNQTGFGVPNFYREFTDNLLENYSNLRDEDFLFPNPSLNGIIYLKYAYQNQKFDIRIFDLKGQKYNFPYQGIGGKFLSLNVSTLPKGVYLLKLEDEYESKIFRLVYIGN